MKSPKLFQNLTRKIVSGSAVVATVASISLLSCSADENISSEENSSTKTVSHRGAGQGTDAGYFWTLWSGGGGTSDISFPQSSRYPGNFRITYTNDACVGGKGWATGTDSRVINYNVGYLTARSTYDAVGVYGWVQNPLIEYYVTEAGFSPWDFGERAKLGDVYVDGNKYVFSRHKQENKPSIEGTKTFWQYIDNWGGQTFNGNKKISMKGHVDNWKRYGGKGWGSTHNYQVFAIEAFGGKTGTIDATVW
jgi:endo-1,4-beta-xylanase